MELKPYKEGVKKMGIYNKSRHAKNFFMKKPDIPDGRLSIGDGERLSPIPPVNLFRDFHQDPAVGKIRLAEDMDDFAGAETICPYKFPLEGFKGRYHDGA